MTVTMTIPNNSSVKFIAVQIPTSSGDAIEAWVYRPEGYSPSSRDWDHEALMNFAAATS
jgi:hypothetical protein